MGVEYAVLFDLDGVIIDTRSATSEALRVVATATSDQPVTPAAVDRCVALPPVDALTALGVQDACRVYEQRFDHALADAVGQLRVFDAVVAGMIELSNDGVGLGIVTAQARRRLPFLLPTAVADLVDVVVAHEDALPKPAPDGLLAACAQLGVRSTRALFLGDTATDIIAGRAARVRTIGVGWGFVTPEVLRRAGADIVLTEPHQVGSGLLAHLKGRPGPELATD
ncbi:MAG: HAD family hydrolase [Dermatophilaceae bacterium]